jgi:hypothetical protein
MDPKRHSARRFSLTARGRLAKSALIAALATLALTVSVASFALAQVPSFPDVPSTSPFYTAITDLAGRGIIQGYDTGDFGPADSIMRQQFAKMIVLTAGYGVSEADVCPFADVPVSGPSGLYPDNYIAVAAAKGITAGVTSSTFAPYAHITRYQVITMVVRAADSMQPGLLGQPPAGYAGSTGWGNDPVHGASAARAEYNGLLTGLDLATSAYAPMTRGEVAQVLYNLLGRLTSTTTTTGSSTTTTAISTTTTAPTTTTTTASSTTTVVPPSTTTTTAIPGVPQATEYVIAGLEQNTLSFRVLDQFGNPLPGVEVFLTSGQLEGNGLATMSHVSMGVSDGNGGVACTWGQAAGRWGVEQVSIDAPASLAQVVAVVQWIYDDTLSPPPGLVSATAGQSTVIIYSGFAEWSGKTLRAHLNPLDSPVGTRLYASSVDTHMQTSHTWVSGQGVFVGANSTNTDGARNWIYDLVP